MDNEIFSRPFVESQKLINEYLEKWNTTFDWLKEIYEEAKKSLSDPNQLYLPKTPCMRRKRQARLPRISEDDGPSRKTLKKRERKSTSDHNDSCTEENKSTRTLRRAASRAAVSKIKDSLDYEKLDPSKKCNREKLQKYNQGQILQNSSVMCTKLLSESSLSNSTDKSSKENNPERTESGVESKCCQEMKEVPISYSSEKTSEPLQNNLLVMLEDICNQEEQSRSRSDVKFKGNKQEPTSYSALSDDCSEPTGNSIKSESSAKVENNLGFTVNAVQSIIETKVSKKPILNTPMQNNLTPQKSTPVVKPRTTRAAKNKTSNWLNPDKLNSSTAAVCLTKGASPFVLKKIYRTPKVKTPNYQKETPTKQNQIFSPYIKDSVKKKVQAYEEKMVSPFKKPACSIKIIESILESPTNIIQSNTHSPDQINTKAVINTMGLKEETSFEYKAKRVSDVNKGQNSQLVLAKAARMSKTRRSTSLMRHHIRTSLNRITRASAAARKKSLKSSRKVSTAEKYQSSVLLHSFVSSMESQKIEEFENNKMNVEGDVENSVAVSVNKQKCGELQDIEGNKKECKKDELCATEVNNKESDREIEEDKGVEADGEDEGESDIESSHTTDGFMHRASKRSFTEKNKEDPNINELKKVKMTTVLDSVPVIILDHLEKDSVKTFSDTDNESYNHDKENASPLVTEVDSDGYLTASSDPNSAIPISEAPTPVNKMVAHTLGEISSSNNQIQNNNTKISSEQKGLQSGRSSSNKVLHKGHLSRVHSLKNDYTGYSSSGSSTKNTPQSGKSRLFPANIVTGISSFIKSRGTPQSLTIKEREHQKRLEIQKKQQKEEDILRKREQILKQKIEEQKRKREERMQRVIENKKQQEKEQEDKIRLLEQQQAEQLALKEKEREERRKEETKKKQMWRKKKEAEIEERRQQEEDARLIKLREQEETERQRLQGLEKQKQEFEKLKAIINQHNNNLQQKAIMNSIFVKEKIETHNKMECVVTVPKIDSVTCTTPPEDLKSGMVTNENSPAELNSTYVKTKDEPAQESLPKSDLNKTYVTEENEKKVNSYEMTPQRPAQSEKLKNPDNYNIDDLKSDDETDDEADPKKQIPQWAQGFQLRAALINQTYNPPNIHELFGDIMSPDLTQMFPVQRRRFHKRTSSALWHSPVRPPMTMTRT
ncbi:uncharacterized protein LOC143232332 [Tachypleus tridentatus]|uniref:uncharacterized protein LOC143232332 n=1 Tax=Tachypleus tridentatus TaxID=6853 RepID=UPI003FD0E416